LWIGVQSADPRLRVSIARFRFIPHADRLRSVSSRVYRDSERVDIQPSRLNHRVANPLFWPLEGLSVLHGHQIHNL
jgi:hypothetical protein